MDAFKFVARGVRGGRPAFSPDCLRYGLHTTCYSLETREGLIVFDAGTGILGLNRKCATWPTEKPIAIVFTHFHLDHIAGLSGFEPLLRKGMDIRLYGMSPVGGPDWKDILTDFIAEPYWPVSLASMPATVTYHDLDPDTRSRDILGTHISWCPLVHPQRCMAYKLHLSEGTIVFATDHEPQADTGSEFKSFCGGTDALILDAQYTPEQYLTRRGWGHGTWEDAAYLAREVRAKRLILTHHDPDHTDRDIDDILDRTRAVFPNTHAAAERMVIGFSSSGAHRETALRP